MNQKLLSDLDLGGLGDLRSDLRSEAEVLPEGLDVFLGVLASSCRRQRIASVL